MTVVGADARGREDGDRAGRRGRQGARVAAALGIAPLPGTRTQLRLHLLAAVARVRRSAEHPVSGLRVDEPEPMAVVVQRMVDVRLAGVAFSRNPTTGLDEVVIETASTASGVVDGRIDPDRWVFRWGRFTTRPADGDGELLEQVARETDRLADRLEQPLDVEWSFDGEQLWWLQARPLTGLDRLTVHSRRIAKEVMPGIISPLTWSVNVPVVNGAWIRLLDRAVGPTGFEPDDLARRFGGRAYFDMTALGSVFEQVEQRMIIDAALHDNVDFDRGQPGTLCRRDAIKDPRQIPAAAAHAPKYRLVEAVETNGHSMQTGIGQFLRHRCQQHGVCRQRQVIDAGNRRDAPHKIWNPLVQQRLAARQP